MATTLTPSRELFESRQNSRDWSNVYSCCTCIFKLLTLAATHLSNGSWVQRLLLDNSYADRSMRVLIEWYSCPVLEVAVEEASPRNQLWLSINNFFHSLGKYEENCKQVLTICRLKIICSTFVCYNFYTFQTKLILDLLYSCCARLLQLVALQSNQNSSSRFYPS